MSYLITLIGKSGTGRDTIADYLVRISERYHYFYCDTAAIEKEQMFSENKLRHSSADEIMQYDLAGKIVEKRYYWVNNSFKNYFTIDRGELDNDRSDFYIMLTSMNQYKDIKQYWGDRVIPILVSTKFDIRYKRVCDKINSIDSCSEKDKYKLIQQIYDDEVDCQWKSNDQVSMLVKNNGNKQICDIVKDIDKMLRLYIE